MPEDKPTLGKAIDDTIKALEPLDPPARATALAAVCDHLEIELRPRGAVPPVGASEQPTPPQELGAASAAAEAPPITDIRTLKEEKQPQNAQQMACLVAYYLSSCVPQEERRDTVSTSDLETLFKQAHFPLPNKISQVLADAKRSGYMDSPSRGQYKLTAVGHNLVVFRLPDTKPA